MIIKPDNPVIEATRQYKRWVLWRWVERDGKRTKPPFQAMNPNKFAQSNTPATWSTYQDAVNASDFADGIGLMLSDKLDDGFDLVAFDLDKCRDPETGDLTDWARDLVERCDSYTEVTPSGTGLRIIGRGGLYPAHMKLHRPQGGAVEVYARADRYITLTGDQLAGTPDQLADLDEIVLEHLVEAPPAKSEPALLAPTKPTPLNLRSIPPDLQRLIEHGAPEGERSEKFHHAVGWLKDLGYTPCAIVALLERHPNGIAEKYRGRLATEVERCYEKCEIASPPPTVALEGNLILSSSDFVAGFTAPDYLVDGVVQRRYIYSLTARTGHGKTAVLLTLAASVAKSDPFGTADTWLGRVCYLAGENPDDVRARWLLAADVLKFNPDHIGVHFIPGTFSIPDMFERIKAETEKVGGFDLVIIDTSAAYFQGDDDNSNAQLGNHARDLRQLTTLPGGPCVVVACHPTKSATKDDLIPRGGGAFLNEVDGNLTLWSDDQITTELHWAEKFRGPNFEPMTFKMEPRTSDTVRDSTGRLMPSVVALPVTEADAQAQLAQSLRDEDTVLIELLEHPGASFAEIATEVGWTAKVSGAPLKSKVERAVHALKDERLVTKRRKKWTLTEAGKREAEKRRQADRRGMF